MILSYSLLIFIVQVYPFLGAHVSNEELVCNGMAGLCDLPINKVTFPGSHNSGSGFDGVMWYISNIPAASCWYRNQGLSFGKQLEFGIRYLDIDTCYVDKDYSSWWRKGAWTCHGPGKNYAYAGHVGKVLQQIDEWMNAHPNEVIVINFGRDTDERFALEIFNDLFLRLKNLWEPTFERRKNQQLTMHSYDWRWDEWPTLRQAIESNQRIFLFMTNKLLNHNQRPDTNWLIHSESEIKVTWQSIAVVKSCSDIVQKLKQECSQDKTWRMVELDVFASRSAYCVSHLQKFCNPYIREATRACQDALLSSDRTVNFISVDWVDEATEPHNVLYAAREQNLRNIQHFKTP